MNPQTFELGVSGPPDAVAAPGRGLVAAFVPAADGYPALLTLSIDPRHDPGRPIEQLAPAALAYLFDVLGKPDGLRWVVIDTWGRFFEACPGLSYGSTLPDVTLQRLPGGIGMDAYVQAFGGAGEVALEMLANVVDAPRPVEETPSAREFLDAIEFHGNLPAPGALYRQVDRAAADGDAREMAAAIQLDPVVSATVINYANAARFAAGGKTASVPMAVQRLGTSFVRRVVFVAEMMARYRHGACAAFDYLGYWRNAIATGAAMRGLMPIYELPERLADDVFTTGLVSGIGWLAVAETFPALMGDYLERIAGADAAAKAHAQREIFPCPIRRVTARFLALNEFPDAVQAAVAETAGGERAIFDCLAGGIRVAQALAPFPCLVEPAVAAVPDPCREEWERWRDLAGAA